MVKTAKYQVLVNQNDDLFKNKELFLQNHENVLSSKTPEDLNVIKQFYRILWQLQKETRIVANKTIQYSWEYWNYELDYNKKHGNYPTKEIWQEKTDKKSLGGYIYTKVKEDAILLNTNSLATLTRNVNSKFNQEKKNILSAQNLYRLTKIISQSKFRKKHKIILSTKRFSK